jgi:hypothetical protein
MSTKQLAPKRGNILCQANAMQTGNGSSPEGALQSGGSADARRKITCRGTYGGYDVYVSRPNGSDIMIGMVRRDYVGGGWKALRKRRIIHMGSRLRRNAIAVLVSAWESEQ